MNQTSSFVRKVVYLGVVVVLLLPLAYLSMPGASSPDRNDAQSSGGLLSRLRAKHNLANQQLGNIDPTSATINLATFGFRGVAANILWTKANEYKKKEDWSNMKATVDTIVRLQPFFISVWRFQAWNISYNVSVEWDDYRDRYFWVMEGIRFLQRGTDVNNADPSLLYDTGWFVSHKIGKADEHKQFRWLFVRDDDFLGGRPRDQRDNWLVGKEFYRRAEKERDAGRVFRGTSPLIFYATPGLNNFYYAIATADEGKLDEVLRRAWNNGFLEWAGTDQLGQVTPVGARSMRLALDIPEIMRKSDNTIRLNEAESFRVQADQWRAKLNALVPGASEAVFKEKFAKLTADEQTAWTTPEAQRDAKQRGMVYYAEDKLKVQAPEIAAKAPPEKKAEAEKLAQEVVDAETYVHWITRYRDIINFVYWKTRCLAERTEDALAARRLEEEAKLANQNAALFEAREAYARALEHWRVLMQAFPDLAKDTLTAEDFLTLSKSYRETIPWAKPTYEVENAYLLPLGYGFVSVDEIKDWNAFAARLVDKGAKPEPSWERTFWTALPENLQRAITRAAADKIPLDLTTQLDVLHVLNERINAPDFFQPDQFPGVTLPEDFQKVLALPNTIEDRAPHDLRIANRKALELSLGQDLLAVAPLDRYIMASVFELNKDITENNQMTPPPALPARSYNWSGDAAPPADASAPAAPTPPAPANPAPAATEAPAAGSTPAPATPAPAAPSGEAPAAPAPAPNPAPSGDSPAPAAPAPSTPPAGDAPAPPAPPANPDTPNAPAPAAPENPPAAPAPAPASGEAAPSGETPAANSGE